MSDLDRFQETLLTGLSEGSAPDDLRQAVLDAAPDEALAVWVASWQPGLVDLAGVLVRTWATGEPPTADQGEQRPTEPGMADPVPALAPGRSAVSRKPR